MILFIFLLVAAMLILNASHSVKEQNRKVEKDYEKSYEHFRDTYGGNDN